MRSRTILQRREARTSLLWSMLVWRAVSAGVSTPSPSPPPSPPLRHVSVHAERRRRSWRGLHTFAFARTWAAGVPPRLGLPVQCTPSSPPCGLADWVRLRCRRRRITSRSDPTRRARCSPRRGSTGTGSVAVGFRHTSVACAALASPPPLGRSRTSASRAGHRSPSASLSRTREPPPTKAVHRALLAGTPAAPCAAMCAGHPRAASCTPSRTTRLPRATPTPAPRRVHWPSCRLSIPTAPSSRTRHDCASCDCTYAAGAALSTMSGARRVAARYDAVAVAVAAVAAAPAPAC